MNKKLKNKKTGEVGDLIGSVTSCPYISIGVDFHDGDPKAYHYNSIAELNEHWEDYAPAEPLIKDEKIRKAVRVWAEVNRDKKVRYNLSSNEFYVNDSEGYVIRSLKFKFEVRDAIGLDSGKYTIAELCGEEEE